MASLNRYRSLILLMVLVLAFALAAMPAQAKKSRTLDDGSLEIDWFEEGADLEFRETDNVDYLWVSDDFSLKALEDLTIHFPDWPDPEFIGEDADDRDNDDRSLARRMNRLMPQFFNDAFDIAWDGRVDTSFEEGRIKVTGRITDCSTGNSAAKYFVGFGAGQGYVAIDVKMVDTESGKLLMALHHRVVSGTNISNTESKFSKWVGKLSDDIADEGLVRMYEGGDRMKK